MVVPILYHLLSNSLFHPVFISFPAYKSPTSCFIIFIHLYLNVVYLCSVFLETWSIFDIVVTIRFLEVICATIAVLISLRGMLILIFLDFPNVDSAFVTFSVTLSHAFLFLTSLKPYKFVGSLNFLCFINTCRI